MYMTRSGAAKTTKAKRAAPRTALSVAEARAQLPEIIRRAESGEVIEITRRGVPVAVVRAIATTDEEKVERFRALVDRARAGDNDDLGDAFDDVRDRSLGRALPSFE